LNCWQGSPATGSHGFRHMSNTPFLPHRLRMFEIFGGTCRLAQAFRRLGWIAESWELDRDESEDVLLKHNTRVIFDAVVHGKVEFIWIGIPCSSWSRARRGNPLKKGFPPPLRGDGPSEIWGLKGVSEKDQARIKAGNKMARWVSRLFKLCVHHGVSVVIENPRSSRLWLCPAIKHPPGSYADMSHCAYGAPWRKDTRLLYASIDLAKLAVCCSPFRQNGHVCCGFTKNPHVALEGINQKGDFWTACASAYPRGFCRKLAREVGAQKGATYAR